MRVFVSDGGYFVFPLSAWDEIRAAKARGEDYEGPDAHGARTYLTADYVVALSLRTDAAIADARAWDVEEKARAAAAGDEVAS